MIYLLGLLIMFADFIVGVFYLLGDDTVLKGIGWLCVSIGVGLFLVIGLLWNYMREVMKYLNITLWKK
ncbi:membrane protein [Bacillus phage Nachito]|nr:membrane protein [Bacillus phage Nachito]